MALKTYINRVCYLDNLIRTKATGNVKQLAQKLNLSERAVHDYLNEMKELGCPIKYCRKRNSYYYETDGNVIISFFDKSISKPFSGGGKEYVENYFVKKSNCKNIAVSVYNLLLCFKNITTAIIQNGAKFQYQLKQCNCTIHKAA